MVEIDLSQLTNEELNQLAIDVGVEQRARQVLSSALEDVQRIAEEAEAKRQMLAVNFISTRDSRAPQDGDEAAPRWIRPTGAHNVYPMGYIVSHGGKVWTNTHYANSWEPGTTNSQWIQKIEPDDDGTAPIVEWGVGQVVAAGDIRTHNGEYWKAKLAHTTHEGWAPSEFTHAVWERTDAPEEETPPVEEPVPDPEEPGEPPVDPEEPEEPATYPAWSKDASYSVGDKVTHNGKVWECLVAHGAEYQGTWAPGIAHTVWRELGSA